MVRFDKQAQKMRKIYKMGKISVCKDSESFSQWQGKLFGGMGTVMYVIFGI